jgi:protein tyrosine phosphatase domain-containing protein 1
MNQNISPQHTLSNSGSLSPTKKNSIAPSEFSKKSKFLCTFCGGKKCKHENYLNHPNPAIKGLNSDWITDKFLAMQRPSSRLIKEHNIIEQFQKFFSC